MARFLSLSFAVATLLLASTGAMASSKVQVAFGAVGYSARYSQGLNLDLLLTTPAGAAIDGAVACRTSASPEAPCTVTVEMRATDGSGETILVTAPDVAVDAAGRARARLTLVDGRHGDAEFQGAPDDGFPYTLTVRFRGAGLPLPDTTDPECQPAASDVVDGRLCPATATAPLLVTPEVPALEFAQDVVMTLGETVTLFASISDETGDADLAGDAADGTLAKNLEGLPIRFFYDVDANGRPSLDERLGEALTNAQGVASFDFTADPAFATAGVFEAGLQAEFPGDRRYALARTAVRATINASGPEPSRTIVEVTPDTIDANGVDESVIRVRLVDDNGNLLGPDSPAADVVIAADLGRLIDAVERDPLDGTYSQVLRSGRQGGTATITVTVDGEPAGEVPITIVGGEGCTCSGVAGTAPLWACIVVFGVRRRRVRARA